MSLLSKLVDQYLGQIKYDPRVFSRDVMPIEQFEAPFREWVRQAINTYLLPEFLRYEYKPAISKWQNQLYDTNQQMGMTGAWRSGIAKATLNDMANAALRAQEQLTRSFNDRALRVMDTFLKAWADPLYKRQMQIFYNSAWANRNLGKVTPKSKPTLPSLSFYKGPTNTTWQRLLTPFIGGNNANTSRLYEYGLQQLGSNNLNPTTQFQADRNLFRQYFSSLTNGTNINNMLA